MHSLKFRPELVHPTVYIARGAIVTGDVTLEEQSSVWFNAVVRGDVERVHIGFQCNIQDGAVLHADPGFPCTLGKGVSVGHLALVHGATIENRVLIGMHATVLNGAVIGEGSIVAAGALVKEGTVIPPNSLVVGMPLRIARQTTERDISLIDLTALHYAEADANMHEATVKIDDVKEVSPNRLFPFLYSDEKATAWGQLE